MTNKELLEKDTAINKDSAKDWQFGVVANISHSHLDENGVIRYGTKSFVGGTKVYLPKSWIKGYPSIGVIGLNRFKRFAMEYVPVGLLENVRVKKVYKPRVMRVMAHYSFLDGVEWWDNTVADRKDAEQFVKEWYNK